VTVPQLLLFGWQLKILGLGDHVLNTDEAGAWGTTVVDETLTEVLADVGAEVMGVNATDDALSGFVGVDVQCVEVFTDVVEGFNSGSMVARTCV